MNRSGFTLIELMLALSIFTLIGVATVKHITQLQNTKNAAFEEMDLYNDLRAAVSLMRFDLNQAFHVLYDDLGAENKQAVNNQQGVPHSLFDGRKNELVFTSLSHRVYYAGKKECEQTEISYFLQRKEGATSSSLMKRESEFIDADLYQGGQIYTLVDNVASLDFKYWDDKQQKWVDDWNSDNADTRDRFPYAVRVHLAIGQGKEKLEMETSFKVAFPNNQSVLVNF